MGKLLCIKDSISAADYMWWEEEGIDDEDLQLLYHHTKDRMQKMLILEIVRLRNIYFELEEPREAA